MRTIRIICTFIILTSYNCIYAQNPIIQNLLDDVRLDSLTNFVKQLSGEKAVIINGISDTITSRYFQNPGNEKAFQFMKAELIRWGYQADSLQFNPTGKNLFAVKTGYLHPDKWFMLGAHYDNISAQFTQPAPGADDNASGSSTVLEAARIFANYDFPYTIVFALWDEEEIGLLGSTAYMPSIGSNNETLMGYINVDMLGWDGNNDSLAEIHVRQVANSVALMDRALYCNTAYNIQLNLAVIDPGTGATDHAPFWDNGYSAIGINEEYGNDFNPFWHTAADSLGHFNLSFYQKCSKLVYATIAELALDTVNTISISEKSETEQFQIYPNPFSGKITIHSHQQNAWINKVVLLDCLGQIAYEQEINNDTAVLDVGESLINGIYMMQVFTSHNSFIKKVIKQ